MRNISKFAKYFANQFCSDFDMKIHQDQKFQGIKMVKDFNNSSSYAIFGH